jgi:8-oxo-dGTP diphosphatase
MGHTEPEGCLARPTRWTGRPIDCARLVLRAARAQDAARIVELLADADVSRHLSRVPHPYTMADAEHFIAAAQPDADTSGFSLAMTMRTTGELIGFIGARTKPGTAELGYWLGRPYWGQGYGSEAARRVTRFLFQELGFGTVWASPEPANPASRRVLEKAGLTFARAERIAFPARGDERAVEVLTIERERWETMHKARPHVMAAAAALIDVDGRVLLTERPAGKHMAGLWEFPGGKIEPGETPETALARELDEELGIDVTETCLAAVGFVSHDYDTFHLMMPLYACRQWRGEIHPREGQRVAWVRPSRMNGYPVPPADIPLVASLRDLL